MEADNLLTHIDLGKTSIEAAAELRALGDWHVVSGRWQQASERFDLATRVDQLDDPEVRAEDQLKLGSALVESGDLRGYEQFRQTATARFTAASKPGADWTIKVALLQPADQKLLESLKSQAELVQNTFQSEDGSTPNPAQEALRSETMALLEYRRGNYATAAGW